MKTRTTKKLLSLLLALMMAFSLGTTAFAEEENDLLVTFVTDEHATVDLYYCYDSDSGEYGEPDEINVTSALVRGKGSPEIDNSGDGQVNFRVNVEDGYTYTVVPTPEGNYKNCKGEDDTGDPNIWRVTKITGDLTITITTQQVEDDEPEGGSEGRPEGRPEGGKPSAAATEINENTVWSYLDDGTDPAENLSDRTDWTLDSYDVSAWETASGSFGAKNGAIADLGGGYIPAVLLNQYKEDGTDIETFFFRTVVNVADPAAVTAITGSVIYDDAATIYLNGTKIAGFDDESITENIQYGGSNAGTPKTGTINVADADQIASLLVKGQNIVAVELHQGRASSSDVYFEMPSLVFDTTPVEAPETEQSSISISMGADETQRNFTWYCNEAGDGILYLAKNSDLVNGEMPENAKTFTANVKAAANKTGYYSNQVTATGLEYGTTYAYQLVNGETKSEIMTFTTGTSGAFSFAFAGDPQIGAGSTATDIEGWANSLGIIANNSIFSGVDFLLSAGDQVNTANSETEYDGYLDHEELYSLPVATVVGNHDSTSAAYDEHFNVPNESTLGASTAGGDYYFVYNNVLFLVLNSNNTSTAEHKAFMEQAIAATAGQDITWKIVTFHHSIYSVASHALEDSIINRRNGLVPVFDELDIDVVLMGHDHVYCRTYMMDGLTPMTDASIYDDADYSSITDPTGILYVTANSASGSKFYSIQNVEFPYSRIMNQEKVPNVSRVDVSDGAFTITTYRTSDMSVVDTFTIYHTDDSDVPDDNNPTDGDQPGDNQPDADQPGDNQPDADQPGDNQPGEDPANGDQTNGDQTVVNDQTNGAQTGNTDKANNTQNSSTSQNTSVTPKTGDNSNILLCTGVLLSALLCGIVLTVTFRKKRAK